MVPAVERDLVALVGDLTKERRRAGADREGRQERPGQERADTVEPERIRAPHLEEKTRPERAPDRRARPVRAHGDEERGAEARAPEEVEQSRDTLREHVDPPPPGLAPQARLDGRADRVGHIRERPRLRAVANHRERLTAEELAHEDRDDAPAVQPVESRTVDVEVAENDDGEAHPREGEAEVLARGFRRRVAPAVDLCRAEHAVRVLVERHGGVPAVDLRGRAEDHLLLVTERRAEDLLGPVDVHREDLVRVADVVLDADHGRQVIDEIRPGDEPLEDGALEYRLADDPKFWVGSEMADLEIGRRVEHGHLVAPSEPRLREVRPEKARASRDEDLHAPSVTRAPGRRPRLSAHASAGSSAAPARWTRVSRSAPSPVATVIPREGRISSSVPGAAPLPSPGSTVPPHRKRRCGPSPTNAPGYGWATARIMLATRAAGHVHSTRPSSGRRRWNTLARAPS